MLSMIAAVVLSSAPLGPNPALRFRKMAVVVRDVPQAFAALGISQDEIRQMVELEVRRDGIEVLSPDSDPPIFIEISLGAQEGDGVVGGALGLYLYRYFKLPTGESVAAVPWRMESTGLFTAATAQQKIRGTLATFLTKFSNEYVEANAHRAAHH